MKKNICFALAVVFCFTLFSGAVLAQEEPGAAAGGENEMVLPLTMENMTGNNNAALSIPVYLGDKFMGISPLISGQYWIGNIGIGLAVPMGYYSPDEGDSGFALGNPTVKASYVASSAGAWTIHYGGSLALGVGILEADDVPKLMANAVGMMSHQDPTYHMAEYLVIRPLILAGMSNGQLLLQLDLGAGIEMGLVNTDDKDTEAQIMFALGAGYKVMDMLTPLLEIRGAYALTAEEGEPDFPLWINVGVRLAFGGIKPVVRLGIAVNEDAKVTKDDTLIHFEVGAAYEF